MLVYKLRIQEATEKWVKDDNRVKFHKAIFIQVKALSFVLFSYFCVLKCHLGVNVLGHVKKK